MNLNCSFLPSDKRLFFFLKKETQYSVVETALTMEKFSGITEDIVTLFLFSY